jgi:CheY-like chemotaxis protein
MKPLKVLVAEDNLVNQKVVLRLLSRLGCEADVVADGQAVLDALDRKPYDLILMDLSMPEMDGITATRLIIQQFHPSIRPRIIALTASDDEADRELCLRVGMDDYLAKPVRLEALQQILTQHGGMLTPSPADPPVQS